MRAVNHAATGALIGLVAGEPAVALPLALVSHYLLDAIPHYDAISNKLGKAKRQRWLKSRMFKNFLLADAALCFCLVIVLAVIRPQHWLLAAICAFVAAAPDLITAKYYFSVLRNKPWKAGLYNRFAGTIQWFERPIGALVEISWFVAIAILLLPFLR